MGMKASALLSVTHDWMSNIDEGSDVCSVYFDLRKALDSVAHCMISILIFNGYLSCRSQHVVVDGECSHVLPVLSVVRLGSSTHSHLYWWCSHPDLTRKSTLIICRYHPIRSPINYSILQHDIALWIKTWSMSLQPKKCCAMVLEKTEIRPETLFQRLVVGLQWPFEQSKSSQLRKKNNQSQTVLHIQNHEWSNRLPKWTIKLTRIFVQQLIEQIQVNCSNQ